jgi:tetratricopeptide (TPR) repeat protein
MNQGNMVKAYPIFLKAKVNNPDDPDVDFGIAIAALAGGTEEEVLPHIQRAERICPLNAPGWGNLGNQYFARNDPANAMAAWRKALLIDPDLDQIYDGVIGLTVVSLVNAASAAYWNDQNWKGLLPALSEQNFETAAQAVDEMLRERRRDRPAELSLLAGVLWLRAGTLEKALLHLDPLAHADPPSKQAAFFAGVGLLRNGRYREGLKAWKNAGLRWQDRITPPPEEKKPEKQ